jgi:hypothetical protein
MRKVLISYVREDAAQIDRLVAHLESNHIGDWLDRRDLIPGERWDQVWFIPVRLSRCTLPDLPIGPGGETLGDLHAIDLFRDWVAGCDRLVGAIKSFALEQLHGALSSDNATWCPIVRARSWITRDLALNIHIKKLYDYRCQVCGMRMVGPSGPYAEAARVRPFDKPHRGLDTADNMPVSESSLFV